MIKHAANPEAAKAFLAYLLDPNGGLKILKEMGQPPFIPCRVPSKEMMKKLPEELQKYVEVRD
jgi:molybdate/tungstate transport system substrate-binding protein